MCPWNSASRFIKKNSIIDFIPTYRYNSNMLKDYLAENKISVYKLSQMSGVPYATVNDMANGRVEAERCRCGIMRSLSRALELSMDELYDICNGEKTIRSTTYGTNITIVVRNKLYYSEFEYDGTRYVVEICPVNINSTAFIRELALWTAEDAIENIIWEKMNVILADAKK